jgi:hypothetical protein
MKPAHLIFLCLMLAGCGQHRNAEVREFPDGFHGWAVIVWSVSGYPQLPTDHGKLIEQFPTDGVIITSSKQQLGWAHDEAYFVDATGHRLPSLPNTPFGAVGNIQQDGRSMDYFQQFVGTEAELKAAPIDAPQIQKLFSKLYPAPNTALEPTATIPSVSTNK